MSARVMRRLVIVLGALASLLQGLPAPPLVSRFRPTFPGGSAYGAPFRLGCSSGLILRLTTALGAASTASA